MRQPKLDNGARDFIAKRERLRLHPSFSTAIQDVDVRVAETCSLNRNQHLLVARLRDRHISEFKPCGDGFELKGFHDFEQLSKRDSLGFVWDSQLLRGLPHQYICTNSLYTK